MIDFSKVRNYYIACGYTDMRKQIDGLVAIVQLQFGHELDEASKAKEEAIASKDEYEAKLKDIEKEAEAILADARKRALDNEHRIVEDAKAEAGRIMERARTEAELEKQKAADEVKKQMVVLASMIAVKVVKASIDTTVQEAMVNDTLKEIGESTWLS